MIDLKSAVKIITENNPDKIIVDSSEFNDFYGFVLNTKDRQNDIFAGALDCVAKLDGTVFKFNPISNLELLDGIIKRNEEVKEILRTK